MAGYRYGTGDMRLYITPKDPFVCPKISGFSLKSYDLGMGFRPSILSL